MVYGFDICDLCCGFGITLTYEEYKQAIMDIMNNKLQSSIKTHKNRTRCPQCKGTGWIMKSGLDKLTLPTYTIKRW